MEKDKKMKVETDSLNEGRDKAMMDIDRMINEGMSGGSVHDRYESSNIEEASELFEELPPNKWD